MMKAQAWREAEAGHELDRIVASLHYGYNEYHVSNESRLLYGRVSSDERWECIPHYSTDLNAAWTLFADIPDDFTPRLVRILQPSNGVMTKVYKAAVMDNITMDGEAGIHHDPAVAVCWAWLLWKDFQGA